MKFIDEINKKWGENAAYFLGSQEIKSIPVISTGSFSLDVALGVGGIPRGRTIEIFGPESSGKTTLCQHIIAEEQKQGGLCAFVDVEHALDHDWLQTCGVDIDKLVLSQPDSGEIALDIVERFVRSGKVRLVILDSVASLVPRAEIEGEMGDAHMSLVARLMGQAMRKLTSAVKEYNCTVIFTNQLRANIGGGPWAPQEVTTGGWALRFFASVRLDIRKGQQIKHQDEVLGNKVRVIVKKNKVAPPFRKAEFDIYYNEGISKISELIRYGIEYEIISKGGAWFTIGEQRFQGEQNLRTFLMENPGDIENTIRINLGLIKEDKNVSD